MPGFGKKAKYQRYMPEASPSALYPSAYNFHLVESIDELKEILSKNFISVSFDTETTGLNLDEDFLVGYSFCYNGIDSYYVPVDHADYFKEISRREVSEEEYLKYQENISSLLDTEKLEEQNGKYFIITGQNIKQGLGYEAARLFYNRMKECKYVFMFNARFDIKVFEKYGFVQNNIPYNERYSLLHGEFDMSLIHFIDVQVLVFLTDTNVPYPSLKKSEEYFLGWRGASFEETLGEAENFYYLRPSECYIYAATDALGTFLLAQQLFWIYDESKRHTLSDKFFSAELDNDFLYPLMLMEEEFVNVDVDLLQKYSNYYQKELDKVESEAYEIAGQAFNMGSPKQKSEMLKRLGIITREFNGDEALNKRGELKADKGHLDKAKEAYAEDKVKCRFIDDLLNYATLSKQKGTYTDNFIKMCENSKYGNRLRFSYKTMVVPSGRLAAGGDKKNSYYADSNIQNITKPKMANVYYIHKDSLKELGLDESLYDNARQEYEYNGEHTYMILDWVFKETPWNIEYNEEKPNHFMIEGFEQKLNIRSVFTSDDDKYWVSCDFSAQELRLPALLSREPLWTKTFAEGGDLHKSMAIQMWGIENYDKKKRKMAKKANFGILYGMTAKNFAEDFNMPMHEAEDMVKRYKESAPTLFAWVHQNELNILRSGIGYTLCGRPRRLGWYLNIDNHGDRGLYNFGIRSCTNTVIQGSGADILKMSFLNIYKTFFTSENIKTNRKYIKFLNTVHDEINYNVSRKLIHVIVPKIIQCMRIWWDSWEFPMKVGLDIGTRWGQSVSFKYDERMFIKVNKNTPKDIPRYRYISYDELPFEEGVARGIIGKHRYVEDVNGEYIRNSRYLCIQEPDGEPYNPKDFVKEEVKEDKQENNIQESLFTDEIDNLLE